jgi:hypothetical protein
MSGVFASYALGLCAVVGVVVAWVGVQGAWRRMFAAPGVEPDVLARRRGCGGCGCGGVSNCQREETEITDSAARSAGAIRGDAPAGLASHRGS